MSDRGYVYRDVLRTGEDVFRKHWRNPRFWRWWWHSSLTPEFRSAVGAGLLVLLVGAGWLAATRLSSADAGSTRAAFLQETTVERTVTVHTKRTPAQPIVHVVTREVVRHEPTTRVETQTVVVTAERVVTNTALLTRTVTHERVVTRSEPHILVRTVRETMTQTAPPVTLTETLPPETVIVTVTVKHH